MKTLMNIYILTGVALCCSLTVRAQDVIELETTTIKGNTELPKSLYVVPWQDKTRESAESQKLVLHNLYGDLFDPVMPAYISSQQFKLKISEDAQKKK